MPPFFCRARIRLLQKLKPCVGRAGCDDTYEAYGRCQRSHKVPEGINMKGFSGGTGLCGLLHVQMFLLFGTGETI